MVSMMSIKLLLIIAICQSAAQNMASSCKYGGNYCILPCHCANSSNTCDSTTGQCTPGVCASSLQDSSDFAWTGSSCQLGNIARSKQTSMSSEYCKICSPSNGFTSSLAVDGRSTNRVHDPSDYFGNCASTAPNEQLTWWKVDFGSMYIIYNLTTIGHNDGWASEFALGYTVTVSVESNTLGDICATAPKTGGNIVSLRCGQPLVGQYLTISRALGTITAANDNKQNYLILCEVIIWGVSASYTKLVSRSFNQLQVTEVSVQESSAIVKVSWNVTFGDSLAASFYGYQVQYSCNSGSSWTNGSSVLASNSREANVLGLPSNVPCQIRITPVGIQNYVAINDTPSDTINFKSSCPKNYWGPLCLTQCGQCFKPSGQVCDYTTGNCLAGCLPWYFGNPCRDFIAPLVLAKPTVTQVSTLSSTANIIVTWSAPPVNSSMMQYYCFQVQFRQISNLWMNATIIRNYDALREVHFSGLLRGVSYEFQILPLRRQNNVVAVDSASITTTIITPCLVQNWGQSCTQTCGKCSNTEIPCDFTTGKCPPPGCSPWFTDERCLTELVLQPIESLNATALNGTTVVVAWSCNTISEVIQPFYFYYLTTSDAKIYGIYNFTTNANITLSGLQQEASYDFQINVTLCRKQGNSIDCGDKPILKSFATPCGVPDNPSNITYSCKLYNATHAEYLFTWQPPVYVRCNGGVTYKVKVTYKEQQQRQRRDTGQLIFPAFENFAIILLLYDRQLVVTVSTVNKNFNESDVSKQSPFDISVPSKNLFPDANTSTLPSTQVPESSRDQQSLYISLGILLPIVVILLIVIIILAINNCKLKKEKCELQQKKKSENNPSAFNLSEKSGPTPSLYENQMLPNHRKQKKQSEETKSTYQTVGVDHRAPDNHYAALAPTQSTEYETLPS